MTAVLSIGCYGRFGDRVGVCVDHAPYPELVVGGCVVARDADGRLVPVLCGEIIATVTEDGPSDGRCGLPVVPGRFACEGHADERDRYLASSPIDRWAQELQEEGEDAF